MRPLPRLGSLLPWMALFVASLAVRGLRFGLVLTPEGVRFPHGADEMYHLRRIWFTVVNFPASLDFDRYLNHPLGAPPIWPPLFDGSIAAVARALVGAGDQGAVERVAVWAPPVIGALGVLAAATLARRLFGSLAGWATGAWLAVLPAHVFYGTIGEVDHHVAVGLFVTALVAAAARLAGPLAEDGRARGALLAGLAAAVCLLLWPGALLHVLAVEAALAVQVLASETWRARARGAALMHATAALALAPFCLGQTWAQYGAVSPLVLSSFQPLWLGAGALTFAGLAGLWARPALGATRGRRIASASGLAGLGLAAAWLLVPGLAEALRGAAGWFAPDPFLGVVSELAPLLAPAGRFDPTLAHDQFSYLLWVYPFAAAWLAWRALAAGRGEVLLVLAWSAAFAAATLHQQRFTDVFAAGFAIVVAPALVGGLRTLRERSGVPRFAVAAAALVAVALALLPYLPSYRLDLAASLAARRGATLGFGAEMRQRIVQQRLAHWMRAETPPTRGYLDPRERPAYGVLAAWGHGHQLRYYAERPMVQDNFGPWGGIEGFESARAYYESRDEEDALAIAERLGARYVVAAPQGSGQRWPSRGSLATRLALVRGRGGALDFPTQGVEALQRHRLVFVADDADLARGGDAPWALGLYEIVPAARVRGSAPPGTEVRFERRVPLPGREPLLYRVSARADAAGRYELRLPYGGEPAYRVLAGGQAASLLVGEAEVRKGRDVAGPSFLERAIDTP